MKKLYLLCAILIMGAAANATHLMGGEITVTKQPGGLYKIRLTYYRDTIGVPLSSTEMVDIFATGGPGSGGFGMLMPAVTLNYNTVLSQSLVPSFPYGVEVGVYEKDSINLPGGYFKIISNTCCRNGAILNAAAPLSESLVLSTDGFIPAGGNSTPGFMAMPIANFEVNTTTTYNPLPFDPDADSIAWDFNTPVGTYVNTPTSMLPVAGFTPLTAVGLTMNAITGQITWTPTTTGNFIQSFKVNEYKNGVLSGVTVRDMQYVVLPEDSNNLSPNFAMVSPYQTNTQHGYYYNYYTPGQPYNFEIRGVSASAGAMLNMSSNGEPYQMANPATFTVTGTGNNIKGTFNWTPPASLKRDILVTFRVGNGTFTKDFTLLLRKNEANNVTNTQSIVNSFLVYPNPVRGDINIALEMAVKTNANISIYNSIGQSVHQLFNGVTRKGTLQLTSRLDLPSGTYFVVLKNADGILKTQPISVQ